MLILASSITQSLADISNPSSTCLVFLLPISTVTPILWPLIYCRRCLFFIHPRRLVSLRHCSTLICQLYNPSANHPAEVPIDLDIDENLGEDTNREMIWKEILYYHPEANAYDPLLVLISASTLACKYKNLLFSCGHSLVSS
ncbi:unnamed protein product [Musa acuminata var. zebrina]